jgi:hypothetical protein
MKFCCFYFNFHPIGNTNQYTRSKNLLSECEFRENRRSDSQNSNRGVSEFISVLTTLNVFFGRNAV